MSIPADEPWFRAAFRGEYLNLYAHRDEAEAEAMIDLALRATALQPPAPVLDAPCGAGRHLRALARRGYTPKGIDLSTDLLRQAVSSNSQIARADIRALPLAPGRFPLVLNLFTSLGYFDDDRQNAKAVSELVRMAAPGAHIVIDFLNTAHLRSTLNPQSSRDLPNGWTVHERRWIEENPARVIKEIRIEFPTEPHRPPLLRQERVRLLEPEWFEHTLAEAGATIHQTYGSYHGDPFSPHSPRWIAIIRKHT